MSLFENHNTQPPINANISGADASVISPVQTPEMIVNIKDNAMLFSQLNQVKDIPPQFLPESSEYCLVVTHLPAQNGELSDEVMSQINAFARAHINDPIHARWLLVHTQSTNSIRPQSTLVCFIKHFSPNALVDNTEGAGVANQIVVALQGLQSEGLVTTNVNYELIRKMSKQFGVLFGGSFAEVANNLRAHFVEHSVKKTNTVAHEKGLFKPTHAPTPSLSLGSAKSHAGANVLLEDENY